MQNMDTLAGIIGEIEEPEHRPIQVDLTPFFKPNGDKKFILEWRNPTINQYYRVANDARALLAKFPNWDDQLAIDVATVAACHLSPNTGGLPVGLFYAQIANSRNDLCWYEILRRLREEFPHFRGNTMPEIDEILDMCAEFYARHPDEMPNVSSEAVTALQRMAARKAARTNL